MFEALLKSFPMAMGIAFSAAPVLAVIMLLMTNKAKINTPIFLIGWLAGIQVVGTVIILSPGIIADHGGMSDHTGTAKIVLGTILLLLIIPAFKKKSKQADTPRIPKIFNSLDNFSLAKIFFIGFAFSGLSLKNAVLAASGAAHIHTTSLIDYFETIMAVFFFSFIASFTLIIPVVIYFLMPIKMDTILLTWRNWLIKNHWNIVLTMLLVAGVLMISIGVKIHMA